MKAKAPAAEVRRLARIHELAVQHRRTGRALDRAIRAAHERGISVRKIAAAAGIPQTNVWRKVRPGDGHADAAATDMNTENGLDKRKVSGT